MLKNTTLSLLLCLPGFALAAEGMWTLDNLPRADLEQAYQFKPDQKWLDHARLASARLAGGCSGSFVSPEGLVLTNQHCVIGCVSDLSSPEHDYVNNGFLANKRQDEKQCPGAEINRLESVSDVTGRILKVTNGLTGKAYNDAKKAEQSRIESECVAGAANTVRCDLVELYQGGVQHLYRYTRFQDVRLVFAPEYQAGFFGGDPDNFNFPRFNLDMGLLRVYENGKPARIKHYLPIKSAGAEPGELVMTLGHPGSTQRLLTAAQLETLRDVMLPFRLMIGYEYRGLVTQFASESAENARIVRSDLTNIENGLKVRSGQFKALLNTEVLTKKRADEASLQAYVQSDAARAAQFGNPWADIAAAQAIARQSVVRYQMIEGGLGFASTHLNYAKSLMRAADERQKPDGERLREFAEAGLPAVEARLLADVPVYPNYEKLKLGWSLTKLRERLGTDHPFVQQILGKKSPQKLAAEIIEGSHLADPKVRKALWEGGQAAVAASQDPAIMLMREIDPVARRLRAEYETEVESVEKRAAERLAAARFAQKGTTVYPDATFSLRLSHGVVRGFDEDGDTIAPFTDFNGLYRRATADEPFNLAPRWTAAQSKLNLATRFNQVTTNDIIGGNSGSPLLNANGEIVGLAFDGNIHSLGGAYFYDETQNRTVSVHPAAILAALKTVYGADKVVKELTVR
ncbi:S46 family peptidase [Ahniella affigens]|uniref:Dipeptidyl-peptidase n=1 Tax=Ahniella affigens TaxID=2021234 RepID=A0A2P1PZ38_9GAMM|nr:S46 family peptidase [Ahniella affigens]AVQ00096.1 S46 family peptidase [Ahniella affigens]